MRLFPIRHAPAPLQLRRRKGAGGSSAQHVLLYSELAVLLDRATVLLASAGPKMGGGARLPSSGWRADANFGRIRQDPRGGRSDKFTPRPPPRSSRRAVLRTAGSVGAGRPGNTPPRSLP